MDHPLISTTQTQEYNEILLACTADVGKPPGYVTWWRFRADDGIVMIGQSDLIEDEAGNCEFFASVNTTYEVSKEDNGAFFRCTSDSNPIRKKYIRIQWEYSVDDSLTIN